MTDREKVINGLKLLANWPDGLIITDKETWIKPCCEMAVALLEEREPMAPIYDQLLTQEIPRCGKCGYRLVKGNDKYCCRCGKAVKWND